MSHKINYLAGQISIHYKPTSYSTVQTQTARGKKAEDLYLNTGSIMCHHGQLDVDRAINFFTEIKKEMEEKKNGSKRKIRS